MSNYSSNKFNLEHKNTSWFKIFSFISEGSMILDVGCSSGHLGAELKKRKNCTVYGTEIDKEDSLKAQKVLDKSFFYNIETEPLPKEIRDKKYDYIIFADVIEHLVGPIGTLEKIKPLLMPSGKVIFSIPNMGHISVRMQLLGGNFNYTETGLLDKTHLHFYDFAEVERVFNAAGYEINHTDNNTLTYPPSFLNKKLADLKLADKGFIKDISSDSEANAFQFVGYAGKTNKGSKPKNAKLNTSTPEQELTNYIDSLAPTVTKLKKSLLTKEKELERSKNALHQAQTELSSIKESATWKAGRAVTTPIRVVRRSKRTKK
jgi:2-polyprenyl-3-methyl-5-hydroxy-6-metoxy-1,4-benzoquinol methylase